MMTGINSNTISLFAPYYETDNMPPFVMKISGTTYEVTTHFSTKGKEIVLQQFKNLLVELDLI